MNLRYICPCYALIPYTVHTYIHISDSYYLLKRWTHFQWSTFSPLSFYSIWVIENLTIHCPAHSYFSESVSCWVRLFLLIGTTIRVVLCCTTCSDILHIKAYSISGNSLNLHSIQFQYIMINNLILRESIGRRRGTL